MKITKNPSSLFDIKFVAGSEVIKTSTHLRVLRDLSIEETTARLEDFDNLLVPGGAPWVLLPLIENMSSEFVLVKAFANQSQHNRQQPQIIFSVCTGELFLGAAGVFANMTATTHHLFRDLLRDTCQKSGVGETRIIESRYVDGGTTDAGVRVISAGGVSSGLDSACYLVSTKLSEEKACFVADVAEYDGRRAK
jgi:transcriptional regulator GlxA family with amidase domain